MHRCSTLFLSLLVATCCTFLIGTGSPALAQGPSNTPTFSFHSSIESSAEVGQTLLGDLNGDGYLDIVTSGSVWNPKQIFLNDSRGHFGFGITYGDRYDDYLADGIPNEEYDLYYDGMYGVASDIALGDIDGDGDLDIITAGEYVYDAYYCLCYLPTENWIYPNDGLGNFAIETAYAYGLEAPATSVEIADMNGDGHLDIVTVGAIIDDYDCACMYDDPAAPLDDPYCTCLTQIQNTIYLNDGTEYFSDLNQIGFDGEIEHIEDITLGDFDGDSDIDLIASGAYTADFEWTYKHYLFRNDGQGNLMPPLESISVIDSAPSFNVGDINGDNHLDIVAHITGEYNEDCACYLGQHKVVLNNGLGEFGEAKLIGSPADSTLSMAPGDLDNDGDIDFIVATSRWNEDLIEERANFLYINEGLDLFNEKPLSITIQSDFASMDSSSLASFVVGDLNNDGFLDLVSSQYDYYGESQQFISLNELGTAAGFDISIGSSVEVNKEGQRRFLTFPYTLTANTDADESAITFDRISASHSLDNGMTWQPSPAITNTQTTGLPLGDHTYRWDLSGIDLYGTRKENVLLKVVASIEQPHETLSTIESIHSTYLYTNVIAGPFIWGGSDVATASISISHTVPISFSHIATQLQVVDESGSGVSKAFIYRLHHDRNTGAKPLATAGDACQTDVSGTLNCWGRLSFDDVPASADKLDYVSASADKLIALRRITQTAGITFTENVRIFETSAPPIDEGLKMAAAIPGNRLSLVVSPNNVLALFDLDVSLEWDSSLDGTFETDLRTAFLRASEVLYDVSNGQIGLGNVSIYRNKKNWATSDIVIYTNSTLRPRATMGGVVDMAIGDKIKKKEGHPTYTKNIYGPGQIRMGPIWDPFGQSQAELTQDWWRALAHELAHYLLFLPDNYLGIENDMLRTTDCIGSFMTNAHDGDKYSEFLVRATESWNMENPHWEGDCTQTIAQALTERTDWETIKHFYPLLREPEKQLNGPNILPLAVTNVRFETSTADDGSQPKPDASTLIPARFFELRGPNLSLQVLPQAQGYLYKTNGTLDEATDDYIVALGSTGAGSDRIKVRGAEEGDRLCLLGSGQQKMGCIPNLTQNDSSIQIHQVADWQPDITVSHVNSTTLIVTATFDTEPSADLLTLQILPSQSSTATSSFSVISPVQTVAATGNRLSTQFTLNSPTFEGFIRLCGPCAGDKDGNGDFVPTSEVREALSQFYLTPAWGPEDRGLSGVNRRDWFANRRSFEAPIASGDGKISIFNVDDILGDTGALSLQAVTNPPQVPPWLTPVGPAYRFTAKQKGESQTFARTIAFQYLQREVPPGFEHTLTIYYLPAEEQSNWQRLPTGPIEAGVDTHDNLATAIMPMQENGEGIYALMATVEMPALIQGWNTFVNPLLGESSITETLASLSGAYSIVYQHDRELDQWRIYDPKAEEEYSEHAHDINDLRTLHFGHGYWLYASEVITPYLSVPGVDGVVQAAGDTEIYGLPPATLVGQFASVEERDRARLRALIDGVECHLAQPASAGSSLWFKLQVASQMMKDGCGTPDRPVRIMDGEREIATIPWRNQRVSVLGAPIDQETPLALPQIDEPGQGSMRPVIFVPLFQNPTIASRPPE